MMLGLYSNRQPAEPLTESPMIFWLYSLLTIYTHESHPFSNVPGDKSIMKFLPSLQEHKQFSYNPYNDVQEEVPKTLGIGLNLAFIFALTIVLSPVAIVLSILAFIASHKTLDKVRYKEVLGAFVASFVSFGILMTGIYLISNPPVESNTTQLPGIARGKETPPADADQFLEDLLEQERIKMEEERKVGTDKYYLNCEAVKDDGKTELHENDNGFRSELDTDNDGIACNES